MVAGTARSIHGPSGERPARGERLETTLREPFPLAADAQPVLGRQVVERRKRGDEVVRRATLGDEAPHDEIVRAVEERDVGDRR